MNRYLSCDDPDCTACAEARRTPHPFVADEVANSGLCAFDLPVDGGLCGMTMEDHAAWNQAGMDALAREARILSYLDDEWKEGELALIYGEPLSQVFEEMRSAK